MAIEQARNLCRFWEQTRGDGLLVITADGRQGNQYFLRGLAQESCAALVRLRRDRALYREPGPYQGLGRPRKHGPRFAFKEPETWGEANAVEKLDNLRWGKVRLRRWDNLHSLQDAETPFSVLLIETNLEREDPSDPLWLAYQPKPGQEPGEQRLVDLWHWYQWRWPVEPSIRFRKQDLYWTLPMFQTAERCDRWT